MSESDGRRWWAVGALTLAVLTIGFDVTIMNVALPTMATALDAGVDQLQWIVNAYILLFAGLMLPIGAVADRFGRRLLLLVGLGLFAAASIGAAWGPGATSVIVARGVLGAAAAVIMPATLATITALFEPRDRGRALAVVVMGMGSGIPLGPIISGWLLDRFWWGSIFLVNVPVVVVAMIALVVLLPETRDPAPAPMDVVGGVVSITALLVFVWGAIEAPDRGWTSPVIISALGAGLVGLAGFVRWELRSPHPMVDLTLFRDRQFAWGSIDATLVSFAMFGVLFVVPQYLQMVLGYDAFGTGLRLLPLVAGFVVGVGGGMRAAGRVGHKPPILVGLLVAAVGLAVGALTGDSSGYGFAAGWYAVAGLGIGAALTPSMDAAMSVLPPDRSGAGTAVTMTMRQAGGALGVAVLGSMLAQTYTDRLSVTGLPAPAASAARDSLAGATAVAARLHLPALAADARAAFVDGLCVVMLACAAVVLLGAVLTVFRLPGRERAQIIADASPGSGRTVTLDR